MMRLADSPPPADAPTPPTPPATDANAAAASGEPALAALEAPLEIYSPDVPPSSSKLSPLRHLLLFVSLLVPSAACLAVFSTLGCGVQVFKLLDERTNLAYALLGGAVGTLALLYLFDASSWVSPLLLTIRGGLLVVSSLLIALACVLATETYPYAPLICSFALPVLSVAFTRAWLLKKAAGSRFLRSLSRATAVIAVATLTLFCVWAFAIPAWGATSYKTFASGELGVNLWGGNVKDYWRDEMGCPPELTGVTPNATASTCYSAAFLWWSYPLWIPTLYAMYAVLFYLLSRTMERGDGQWHSRRYISNAAVKMATKIFVGAVVFFAVGIWIASSVAGTGLQVAQAFEMAIIVFIAATLIITCNMLGWTMVKQSASEAPLMKKIMGFSDGFWDYIRALTLWAFWPLILLYFVAELLRERVREVRLMFSTSDGSAECGARLLTTEASSYLKQLLSWHWGSVLTKISAISLVYLCLEVLVMQATTLFLAYVNELLAPLPLWAICLIFSAIGIVMFMIPVVPGVPVYLTAGVIIPAAMMGDDFDQPGVPASFWWGILLASGVGLALKLIAVAMEQELIGRFLGGNVGVRRFCQVNSIEMRAVRKVLSRPGLGSGKCAILVGGPDWPTSVLCGILKLNVFQMMLGTTPIVFLIVPSVAAGGFQLLRNKGDIYESIALVVTMGAMLLQAIAVVGALYVIDLTAAKHRTELVAQPDDLEVLAYDQKAAEFSAAFRAATSWRTCGRWAVPFGAKALPFCSAFILSSACYMTLLTKCFQTFAVSQRISDLPDGKWYNIVESPAGWIVIGALIFGWVLRIVYFQWAKSHVRAWIKAHPEGESNKIESQRHRQRKVGAINLSGRELTSPNNVIARDTSNSADGGLSPSAPEEPKNGMHIITANA